MGVCVLRADGYGYADDGEDHWDDYDEYDDRKRNVSKVARGGKKKQQAAQLKSEGDAALLAAAALVIGGGDGAGLNGASLGTFLWSVPAPIFFGLIIVVLSSMVMGLSPFERMAAGMWGSVIGLAPLAVFAEPGTFQPASTDAWLAIAGLGAVTALVPQLVYTFACARVGPARAAAAGSIELPTMIGIGWLYLEGGTGGAAARRRVRP